MASFEQKVSQNLKCPICLELLSDPKQLSCSHTFCKKCLNNILKCSSQNTVNTLTCQICQRTTDVTDGNVVNLKTNDHLKSLVDDVRNSQQFCEMCDSNSQAVHFCCKCNKNMCDPCVQDHNTWKPNLEHKVVSVEDIREGRAVPEKEIFCQEHKSNKQKHVCTHVCITCKKVICMVCTISHKENGHTVKSAEEYDATIKTEIDSLQAQGETKTATIKDHVTYIKTQEKCVSDHIDSRKAEISKIYEESIKKLNDWKASIDKQLEAQEEKLRKRLDEMKDADERLITSIESASVLAGNSLKAPLEGDIIVIRDSLSGELKNVLDRDDPEKKLATDVADHAEQLIFTPNHQGDQLNMGEIGFKQYKMKCATYLEKGGMTSMASTQDGRMAVAYHSGVIHIYSADGKLQQRVPTTVDMCLDIRFLSSGCYVILTDSGITLHTREYQKMDVTFEPQDTIRCITADSNDLIYVSYWKAKKIQVFSPAGGKAIREIHVPRNGYNPRKITGYNDLLITTDSREIRIVDREGNVKHKIEKSQCYAFAAVTQSNSVLIAWVKDGLVSIDKYTNELKHIRTLIYNHKTENQSWGSWCYLQEFRSGEIAFCTESKLYIFKQTITPVHG